MNTFSVVVRTKNGSDVISQDIELTDDQDQKLRKVFTDITGSSKGGYISIAVDDNTEVWIPSHSIEIISMKRIDA